MIQPWLPDYGLDITHSAPILLLARKELHFQTLTCFGWSCIYIWKLSYILPSASYFTISRVMDSVFASIKGIFSLITMKVRTLSRIPVHITWHKHLFTWYSKARCSVDSSWEDHDHSGKLRHCWDSPKACELRCVFFICLGVNVLMRHISTGWENDTVTNTCRYDLW